MFANKHAKILIALVCAVLGFMLATQFKTTERQKTINIQRAEDLSDRLKAVEKERDELSKEMEKLQAKAGDEVVAREIVRLKAFAGDLEMHGKGIKLVLDDSKIASKPGENPNLYIIHDDDLLRVINELRAAGAEAIAINGERIVAMSEIRCAGPTLSVNNNRSAPPYEIKAIGNPNNLESALKLRGGELHGSTLKETDEYQSCTGYVCQKWISRTSYYDKSLNTYTYTRYAYPYLRLAELYLSYAEADFEYNGSLSGKSLEYINRVRRRCGLPDFEDSWALAGGIPSGQKLRKVLHQERSIEFLFEGRRFHDLRRWKEAPEVMNKQPRSWNRDAKTQDDFYQVIQAAQGGRVRVFESPKSYWLAIPLNQINKNPQLVQNPGY